MVFKLVKEEVKPPEHSDYVKNRIDIAANKGVVYELESEDIRIDGLFKDTNLYYEKSLLTLDRVMIDGEEKLVAGVEYAFYDSKEDVRVDRFVDFVGRTVEPIVNLDQRTGIRTVSQNGRYKYTINFSPEKVDELLREYKPAPNLEFRFYEGSVSTTRRIQPVEVKRREFFKFATWEELFVGKEKRYTSSTVNKLQTLRKEIEYEERQQFNRPQVEDNTVYTKSTVTDIREIDNADMGTKTVSKRETNNTSKPSLKNNSVQTNNEEPTNEQKEEDVVIVNKTEKKSTTAASNK